MMQVALCHALCNGWRRRKGSRSVINGGTGKFQGATGYLDYSMAVVNIDASTVLAFNATRE
jgi:hypothetical protein